MQSANIHIQVSMFISPKTTPAFPDLHWLLQGGLMEAPSRQEEAAEAKSAPEFTQHPQREDQVKSPSARAKKLSKVLWRK